MEAPWAQRPLCFAPRAGLALNIYLHEWAFVISAGIYKHAGLQAKVGDHLSETLELLLAAANVTQHWQKALQWLAPNPGKTNPSIAFGDPKTLRIKVFMSLHAEDNKTNRRIGTGLRWEAMNSDLLVAPMRRQAERNQETWIHVVYLASERLSDNIQIQGH